MNSKDIYAQYDVPQDLQFKTADIIRMGGLSCMAQLRAADFDGIFAPPNKITRVQITLLFSVTSNEILVHGKIEGEREIECARCLTLAKQPFSEEFTESYSTKAEIIDIMLVVRQTLALTEEIRFLCKPDCKGLCPHCGKNLNTGLCACKEEDLSPFAVLKGKFK